MKSKGHSLIFPLLSTLFFLALLLALNAVYEPLELENATPVDPVITVSPERNAVISDQ
jgi:hypothetical protein